MTTKQAGHRLHNIVGRFAHIDLHEIHQCAFSQIDMETVRCIVKDSAKRTDAFIALIGELLANRYSLCNLFMSADPQIIMTFSYRYLLVQRYLATSPPGTNLFLSSDEDRFLEQTLIELFGKVEDSVYHEIMSLHAADRENRDS